jgi:hypothetical protein
MKWLLGEETLSRMGFWDWKCCPGQVPGMGNASQDEFLGWGTLPGMDFWEKECFPEWSDGKRNASQDGLLQIGLHGCEPIQIYTSWAGRK